MASASGLLVIERILRDRQGIWQQVVEDRKLGQLTGQMLVSSVIALACYGAVLGAFHSVLTAEVSAMPHSLSPIRLGTKAGSSSVPMADAKPDAAWMISSNAGRARQGPSWPNPVATA